MNRNPTGSIPEWFTLEEFSKSRGISHKCTTKVRQKYNKCTTNFDMRCVWNFQRSNFLARVYVVEDSRKWGLRCEKIFHGENFKKWGPRKVNREPFWRVSSQIRDQIVPPTRFRGVKNVEKCEKIENFEKFQNHQNTYI